MLRKACALSVLVLIAAPTVAQDQLPIDDPIVKKRPIYRPETPFRVDQHVHADRVEVKFVEGIRIRLNDDGVLTSLDGHDLADVHGILRGTTVERLFTRQVEDLDAERARLQPNVPPDEEPLADLNNYYLVRTDGATTTERVVNALLAHPLIETAYAAPIAVPASGDIPPTTPLFESRQGYIGDAPTGYNYRKIESIVGARGTDIQGGQLEGSWYLDHEDLCTVSSADILGSPPSGSWLSSGWRDHGTACVGIMSASRNAYGVLGMGSDVSRFVVSSLVNGSSNTISLATAALNAGDVMSSSYVWSGSDHKPLDFVQSSWDAVRAATNAGIIYTFSAGNTNSNLDDTNIFGTRYLPATPSSGGFIIAATDGGNLAKASFSTYGTRIDANGWGRRVTTVGYGGLFNGGGDLNQEYTATFSGTSSAAPNVAGTVMALVGAVKEQNGVTLTPQQVRTALQTTGTNIPSAVPIGTRPDLIQMLALHNLPDGLLVANNPQVGQNASVEVSGPAGDAYGIFLSLGRGRTNIGLNRPVLLDTTVLVPFAVGNIDGSGTSTVAVPIPNDSSFVGDYFIQSGQLRSGSPYLTNSAMIWVRA